MPKKLWATISECWAASYSCDCWHGDFEAASVTPVNIAETHGAQPVPNVRIDPRTKQAYTEVKIVLTADAHTLNLRQDVWGATQGLSSEHSQTRNVCKQELSRNAGVGWCGCRASVVSWP